MKFDEIDFRDVEENLLSALNRAAVSRVYASSLGDVPDKHEFNALLFELHALCDAVEKAAAPFTAV